MAKVSYGPIVSDASGKTAGTVFSKWRTRPYIRRLVKPGNPNTSAQQAIRNAFKLQTKRFLRFNSALALAWLTFAAGKPITARSAFIGATVQEERLLTPWPFTPHHPKVFPVLNLVVTPGDTQLGLAWDNDELPATGSTLVFWVNQTDEGLTVSMQEENVDAVASTITSLVNGKVYYVGVTKMDSDEAVDRHSISVVDEDTPSA